MRRCSEASLTRGEPIAGTASTVTSFLLLECPGPWGVEALRDSRLPTEVKQWLAVDRRMRPLLIRRDANRTTRVFVSRGGVVTTTELDDVRSVLDLDLDRDLSPYDDQLYLVCTHGRHDTCCAERGRPLWKALAEAAPEQTWQVSHIGGDRFAANVLVLPHGLYYGRVSPENAADFVRIHRDGRLDLDNLRGRSAYPFHVQAAEIFLRRELGELDVRPFPIRYHDGEGVVFEVGDQAWRVRVRRTNTEELLTCKAEQPSTGWRFDLTEIVAVPG